MAIDLVSGSSQYLTAPSAVVNLNEGTFCAWLALDFATSDGNPHYFFDTTSARHAFYYYNTGGSNVLEMYNDGRVTRFSTFSWTTGVYSHFAFVYNKTGNVQKIYIDGSELTGTPIGGTWGSTGLGSTFYAGARFSAAEFTDGDWAEMATYSSALGATDIATLAKGISPLLVSTNTLNAYWKIITDGRPNFGENALSPQNSPASSTHPRVIYPTSGFVVPSPAVAATNTRRYTLTTLGVG